MIPVLSVRQPWASLIIDGYKSMETRRWSTKYRGKLLIHASGKWNNKAKEDLFRLLQYYGQFEGLPVDTGYIIGVVELVDIVPLTDRGIRYSYRHEHLCVPDNHFVWNHASCGWILKKPSRLIGSIKAKGKLNLWYPSDDQWRKIKNQL